MPDSALLDTYRRLPVCFDHGEGVWLFDTQGRRYLDALAGIAVNTLGHAHPKLVAALAEQAGKLIHTSNLYQVALQEQLGHELCALAGMERAFFCNSGLEANEAAIKLARLDARQRGVSEPRIVVFEDAFHGRSLATLSATGNKKIQQGFEPLVPGFERVPLNDIASIRVLEGDKRVTAVLLETIQGEGGIRPARVEFLRELRRLCDARGWLLMLDEVQCGIGRTGKWFAWMWAEIQPDVVSLAKGLGSGVPIGALLTRKRAAQVLRPGQHGSTFGGNPLACRAALTTLHTMQEDSLVENAALMGAYLRQRLEQGLRGVPGVVEVRGQGLMLGIELSVPCADLVTQALQAGLLINVTHDTVIRLLPPLIFAREHVDQCAEILIGLIRAHLEVHHVAGAAKASKV